MLKSNKKIGNLQTNRQLNEETDNQLGRQVQINRKTERERERFFDRKIDLCSVYLHNSVVIFVIYFI